MLIGLLEGLATADPPLLVDGHQADRRGTLPAWQALRAAVETASRKSELRVVEDQVDAVVCAYVALFADARAGADHDVRRLRDRLHRHADPARRTSRRRRADRGSRRRPRTPAAPRSASTPSCSPSCGWRPTSSSQLVTVDPRRRRHQLPERHRAREVRRVVRGQGRPHRRRPAVVHRPAPRDHRPDRGPGDHLRAQRRPGRRRPARRPGRRPRRPRHGPGDGERGPVRLRQPAPARRPRRGPREPAGVRALARSPGAGPDPHGAAARVGGVRARHPLQGHDPRRARARLRPPVHARRRAARARRPRVLHDPGPAPGRR